MIIPWNQFSFDHKPKGALLISSLFIKENEDDDEKEKESSRKSSINIFETMIRSNQSFAAKAKCQLILWEKDEKKSHFDSRWF